jgi:hypothetical protein
LLFNFCCFSFPQFVKINDFFWYETYPNTITDFIDDSDCEDSTLQQAQPSVTAASEFFDEPNVENVTRKKKAQISSKLFLQAKPLLALVKAVTRFFPWAKPHKEKGKTWDEVAADFNKILPAGHPQLKLTIGRVKRVKK